MINTLHNIQTRFVVIHSLQKCKIRNLINSKYIFICLKFVAIYTEIELATNLM